MSNNINLFADIWGINIRQKTKQIRNHNKVNYEWDIETIDKDGDNQDNFYSDKLKDLLWAKIKKPDIENCHYVLVLIRYKGNDFEERSWAYPENNKMPTTFEDGISVPKRFLVEYEKVWK